MQGVPPGGSCRNVRFDFFKDTPYNPSLYVHSTQVRSDLNLDEGDGYCEDAVAVTNEMNEVDLSVSLFVLYTDYVGRHER